MSNIALTKHAKGFRRMIGGVTWYFGHDYGLACKAGEHVIKVWERLQAEGFKSWPDGTRRQTMLERDRLLKGEEVVMKPSALPLIVQTREIPDTGMTLHLALDRWERWAEARYSAKHIGPYALREIASRCVRLRKYLPDTPLSVLDRDAILRLISLITKRPVTKRTKAPLAVESVATLVAELRRVLDYADELGVWTPPRRWEKCFKIDLRRLRTPMETRTATTIPTFDLPTLQAMYQKFGSRVRLWILLGLNCGFANGEVASLRVSECRLIGANPHIERERSKTHVWSKWNLWQETTDALKAATNGKGPDDLVCTTRPGGPLVELQKVKGSRYVVRERVLPYIRRDYIQQQWMRSFRYYKITNYLSFKYLRKTAGQMIRDLSDKDCSAAFLSHAERGVERHYTRESVEQLHGVISELRKALQPMFDPLTPAPAVAPLASLTAA